MFNSHRTRLPRIDYPKGLRYYHGTFYYAINGEVSEEDEEELEQTKEIQTRHLLGMAIPITYLVSNFLRGAKFLVFI